jgi:hypothetical protein
MERFGGRGTWRRRWWWRLRAGAGLLGPAAFTAAWLAGSSRQREWSMGQMHISGLASPQARDPAIMISGFVVLGGCMALFATALREVLGRSARAGLGPWLVGAGGLASVATGLVRREGLVGSEVVDGVPGGINVTPHSVFSGFAYTTLLAAPVVLARRFRDDPEWAALHRPALVLAGVTGGLLASYLATADSPWGGILQRLAVSVPLTGMAALAVRVLGTDVIPESHRMRAVALQRERTGRTDGSAAGRSPSGPVA